MIDQEGLDGWDQVYRDCGYEWCRAHGEWHRPPECPIHESGATDPWWERDQESHTNT